MSKAQIFPESCYEFTKLSRDEVVKAYESQTTIVGFVKEIRSHEEKLLVSLGDNLVADLPFSEVTIYPFHYTDNPNRLLPVQIGTLLHKNIRVKVTQVTPQAIMLSRKKNMLEAFKYLSKCSSVLFHILNVKTHKAFGDIGDGICASLPIREVCKARIKNVAEVLHRDCKVWTNIHSIEDGYRIIVSYKETFPKYNPCDYVIGDPVTGKIGDALDERHSSYYVSITPQVTGILEVNSWTPLLRYGNTVECEVVGANSRGLKLKFSRIIE